MWTESRMGRHRTRESPRPEQAKKPDPSRGGGEPRGRGADGREGLTEPRTRKEKQPRRATSGGPGLDHSPHAQGSGATPAGGRSQGKGLPKVCNKITHARLHLGGTSCKCTSPGAPSVPRLSRPPRRLRPPAFAAAGAASPAGGWCLAAAAACEPARGNPR